MLMQNPLQLLYIFMKILSFNIKTIQSFKTILGSNRAETSETLTSLCILNAMLLSVTTKYVGPPEKRGCAPTDRKQFFEQIYRLPSPKNLLSQPILAVFRPSQHINLFREPFSVGWNTNQIFRWHIIFCFSVRN
jgi:hypothetical protein